jgi:hypothetical protein
LKTKSSPRFLATEVHRRPELGEERVLEIPSHAEEFCLGILHEAL